MTRRIPIEEKFKFYDTAEECADAAAPLFRERNWRWSSVGIPNRNLILVRLRDLESWAKVSPTARYHSSGRLMYDQGRFGHER